MTTLNKQLSVSIFCLSIFCLASVALAQESSTSLSTDTTAEATASGASIEVSGSSSAGLRTSPSEGPSGDPKTNRIDVQQTFASNTAQRRAEVETRISDQKIALQARAQERVINLAANMSNRMEAVIARLQNVSNRLQSRIEKINARGIDTQEAQNALASAQISIDAALGEIATIDADVSAAISSSDARAGWNTVKVKFFSIRDHITTAHTELRASVAGLKEATANPQTEQNTAAEIDSNSTVDVSTTEIIID